MANENIRRAMAEFKRKKAIEKEKRLARIPDWQQIRKCALDRDAYVCRICGADATEERLDVHHVDWDRTNNKMRNLVTLCSPCHVAIHSHGYRPDGDDEEPWGDRGPRDI